MDRTVSAKRQMLCQAECSRDFAAGENMIHGAVDNLVNIASMKTSILTAGQKLA